MLRGGLISMLYSKTTDLSITSVDPASAMTLMSADIERITTGLQTMHELWVNLIEVAIAIFLLERQLGVACVVPVAVAICKSSCGKCSYANIISFVGWFLGCNKSGHVAPSHVA